MPSPASLRGQLADRRRLAAAVDADDEQHERLRRRRSRSGGAGSDSISALRRRRNAQTASGSASSRRDSELRISSSSFWLVRTPMSAVSSTFSISSTIDGSISFLPAKSSPEARDEAASACAPGRARARAPFRAAGARSGEGDDLRGRRAPARAGAGVGSALLGRGRAAGLRAARRGLGLAPARGGAGSASGSRSGSASGSSSGSAASSGLGPCASRGRRRRPGPRRPRRSALAGARGRGAPRGSRAGR